MTFDNYNVCKKHLHMVREGEQVTLVPEWRWDHELSDHNEHDSNVSCSEADKIVDCVACIVLARVSEDFIANSEVITLDMSKPMVEIPLHESRRNLDPQL